MSVFRRVGVSEEHSPAPTLVSAPVVSSRASLVLRVGWLALAARSAVSLVAVRPLCASVVMVAVATYVVCWWITKATESLVSRRFF